MSYQEGTAKTLWEGLCTTDPPELGQLPSDVSPEPRSLISGRCPKSVCFLEGDHCRQSRGRRYLPLCQCNDISPGIGIWIPKSPPDPALEPSPTRHGGRVGGSTISYRGSQFTNVRQHSPQALEAGDSLGRDAGLLLSLHLCMVSHAPPPPCTSQPVQSQ